MDDITLIPCSNNAMVVPTGACVFMSPGCKSVIAASRLHSSVNAPSKPVKTCEGSLNGKGTMDLRISSP